MPLATLLLAQTYEPITTISWQRAVTLLTLGKVEVIEEYEGTLLRSRSWVIKMPAVVRLIQAFRKYSRKVTFTRQNILARDNWKCQYCGIKLETAEATYDHVTPRSRGGTTCWTNVVTCCPPCNQKKANKTPHEAGMRLKKAPVEPKRVPIASFTTKGTIPEEWMSYLYWNTELDR